MTSVLSYPMSDPFASPHAHSQYHSTSPSEAGTSFNPFSTPGQPPGIPFSTPGQPQTSNASMGTVPQQAGASNADRAKRNSQLALSGSASGSGSGSGVDEFGGFLPQEGTPSIADTTMSTSKSGSRSRHASSGYSPNMSLPLSPPAPLAPVASTSTAYAAPISQVPLAQPLPPTVTTPPSASAQRSRQRQSHNPSATLTHFNPSPPKAEHLTDEYVLHPSVYAFKQAHPRRPMVAFGPYVLLQTLGEGEFGKVKLGVHTEYGVEVAIKLIRRGSLDDEVRANKVEREIDVLKALKHPNIVRMFDVIDTEKYIGIVLEFAGGGELFDHILAHRYLKEKDAQKLFAQLVSGVDYLHRKHIVHRDLKLENLLLDKHRNIIITDFGFANKFEHAADDLMATSCGSPCYAAPELVVSEGLYVGSAVDIWSCGVILYAMLSGYLPYDDDPANPDGDNINLLYKYIMSTRLKFPDHMSPQARHLLQIMLVPNPELRCGINDIINHPWLEAYKELFARTPEDNEHIFQDSMYRKSQAAKRELADRRRVQSEGKLHKAMHRSQSTMPGTAVSAGLVDQTRRPREQRHHSAMPGLPGTNTMPEYLNNAGHRTPPLSAVFKGPSGSAPMPTLPLPTPAPATTNFASEESVFIAQDPAIRPLAPPLVATGSNASTAAVENESLGLETSSDAETARPVTPPPQPSTERKSPLSANKNRHTIQVEYDVDASYEKMQEAMQARGSPKPAMASLEQSMMDLHPAQSDVEMASVSDHGRTATDDSIPVSSTPEASQIVTPLATTPVVSSTMEEAQAVPAPVPIPSPSTPPKATSNLPVDATSPSTPRASSKVKQEDSMATPRQAKVQPDATPRPIRAIVTGSKRSDSMPATSGGSGPAAAETASIPKLNAAGLPLPPSVMPANSRRDRYRKGMSLDKFGLAKLLGQTSSIPAQENRAGPPPSSFTKSTSSHVKRTSVSRPSTADVDPANDKKSKRKTLQLMVNRSSSIRDSRPTTPATPLSPRDLNPTTGIKSQPSPPTVIDNTVATRGAQSTASIVTVDALSTAQTQAAMENKNVSSSAAKKVMDWFRRKSLAKDTLVNLKTAGLKTDSTSSFVRVSDSPARGAPAITTNLSTANLAMSSTSSLARTTEGTPLITVTETLPQVSEESVSAVPTATPTTTNSTAKASVTVSTSDLAPPTVSAGSAGTMPLPARSQSHQPPSPTAPQGQGQLSSTTSALVPTKAALRTASSTPARGDDLKMRVHSGLVDQSALSSRPPQEVMHEVIRVMQDMGMEIKRENEFRLRVTRVRRRKAGPTTGLGLGSVMSVGSGMGPFSLMSSASSSRTDSRGLPMPQSPSSGILSGGGLKGMLLRRGSSYASSTHLPRSDTALSELSPQLGAVPSPQLPGKEALYGEHSVDSGDEVKFNVELCRIKNLPGLYLLNIKRLRGNVWSFKFIYQTVIERCETLTH